MWISQENFEAERAGVWAEKRFIECSRESVAKMSVSGYAFPTQTRSQDHVTAVSLIFEI